MGAEKFNFSVLVSKSDTFHCCVFRVTKHKIDNIKWGTKRFFETQKMYARNKNCYFRPLNILCGRLTVEYTIYAKKKKPSIGAMTFSTLLKPHVTCKMYLKFPKKCQCPDKVQLVSVHFTSFTIESRKETFTSCVVSSWGLNFPPRSPILEIVKH